MFSDHFNAIVIIHEDNRNDQDEINLDLFMILVQDVQENRIIARL